MLILNHMCLALRKQIGDICALHWRLTIFLYLLLSSASESEANQITICWYCSTTNIFYNLRQIHPRPHVRHLDRADRRYLRQTLFAKQITDCPEQHWLLGVAEHKWCTRNAGVKQISDCSEQHLLLSWLYCPQSFSGGGLYLNVKWVTMERIWWVTIIDHEGLIWSKEHV